VSEPSAARAEVLARVRAALATGGTVEVAVPRGRREPGDGADLLALFAERVADYRATVTRCGADEVPATVAAAVAAAAPGGARVLLPPALPWPVPGTPDRGFTAAELDTFDAVVTAATVGIAETGTVVLTHGPAEGRRALSLVPDVHVCVVEAGQVVADVPDAMPLLDPARPQTWISGPSATSDIELDRVEGVHGPRTLHVVLVDPGLEEQRSRYRAP
jgi:L-lactate dehydrogenase complex protein LldG